VAEPGPSPTDARRRRTVVAALAAVIAAAALFIQQALLDVCLISGDSMEPTLSHGARVLVLQHHPALERGDLVVVQNPHQPEELLVKRIIGLPGEALSAEGGRLLVDGRPLEEPWLPRGAPTAGLPPARVPAGRYYVLGDNRGVSTDSRRFGPVEARLIVGMVVGRL
jgi:signal peptidase I